MIGRLCHRCKQRVPGPAQDIAFDYCGFSVKCFRDGITCTECAQAGWLEKFEKVKDFVDLSRKVPAINWDLYKSCRSESQKKLIHAIFISFGMLSCISEGNWEIVSNTSDTLTSLNPLSFSGKAYFVHLADAVMFARLEYAGTLHDWELRQISKVVPKEIALRL